MNEKKVLSLPKAVPLEPIDCVEESRSSAVAGIGRVNALNVSVARLVEERHQERLDA